MIRWGRPRLKQMRKVVLTNCNYTKIALCGADQPISHPRLGDDMLRLRRIALQFPAQMRHVDAQIVMALHMGRPPHVAQQLPVRQHPARMAHQGREQPIFDRREMDGSASRVTWRKARSTVTAPKRTSGDSFAPP